MKLIHRQETSPSPLLQAASSTGDLVLDPWLGSGTTVKVARELNREAVGYEKEPQYKKVIMEKLGLIPKQNDGENNGVMVEKIDKIIAEMRSSDNVAEPIMVEAETGEMSVGIADDYVEMSQNE